jgi:hypothetical protein
MERRQKGNSGVLSERGIGIGRGKQGKREGKNKSEVKSGKRDMSAVGPGPRSQDKTEFMRSCFELLSP